MGAHKLVLLFGAAFVLFGTLIVLYPYFPMEIKGVGGRIAGEWIRYNEGTLVEAAVAGSEYITPADERVISYSLEWSLPRAPTENDIGKLREIYDFIRIRARWTGPDDEWTYPRDMLIHYERHGYFIGDCEDYAALLASLYRAAGVAPDATRVVIGKLPEGVWGGGGHAAAQVRIDNRWLYLEPYGSHTFMEYAYVEHPLKGRESVAFSDVFLWKEIAEAE
jgi:hypothetical protein